MKLKRIMAMVLCVAMVLSTMSFSVFAEDAATGTWGGIDWTLTNDGTLTIAPTQGESTQLANKKTKFMVGEWPEAVLYDATGTGVDIGGWPYKVEIKIKRLVIEEGVTSIGSFAFNGMYTLDLSEFEGEVVIPSTVTYIGQEAFQGAPMSKLTFAEGGTEPLTIAQGAFKNLIIEEIEFPADRPAIYLKAWVLNNCDQLKSVTLPANVVGIAGTNQVDYYYFSTSHNSGNHSQLLCYNDSIETVTFGSEDVKDLFKQWHDDKIVENTGTSNAKGPAMPAIASVGLTYCTSLETAADIAQPGDTIVLLKDTDEAVELPEGVTLDKNGFTADNVKEAVPDPAVDYVAMIDSQGYETFDKAYQAADSGDTIELLETVVIDKMFANYNTKTVTVKAEGLDTAFLVTSDVMMGTFSGMTVETDGICITFGTDSSDYNPTVDIVGGTYKGGTSAIKVVSGLIRIADGTFSATGETTIDADVKNVVANGGKYDFDPTAYVPGNRFATKGNDGYWTVAEAAATIGDVKYADLASAISAAQAGETVTLLRNINLGDISSAIIIKKNITIDGQGYWTITINSVNDTWNNAAFAPQYPASYTFKNLTIELKNAAPNMAAFSMKYGGTLENVTVKGAFGKAVDVSMAYALTVTDCTFDGTTVGVNAPYSYAPYSTVTITGTTFNTTDAAAVLNENAVFTDNIIASDSYVQASGYQDVSKNFWNGNSATGNAPTADQLKGDEIVCDTYYAANNNGVLSDLRQNGEAETPVIKVEVDGVTYEYGLSKLPILNKLLGSEANGDTKITLLDNVTLENGIQVAAYWDTDAFAAVPKTVEIDLNEKTLTGFIQINANVTATIKNGTVNNSSSYPAIDVVGTATVEDMIVTSSQTKAFRVADGTTLTVKTGTYSSDPTDYVADGFVSVDNSDGTFGVQADSAVAKIGDVEYDSLQAAINAAADGDVITVIADINLADAELQLLDGSYDTYFLVEGKNITIDLGGKTISGAYTGTNTMLVGVFSTDNNGHLTITGNGTVDVTATNKVYSLIANYEDGCSITIKNGTYKLDKASDSLIYSGGYTDAAVTVKGGTFTLGNVGEGENGKPWIVNVLGAGDHHVFITGGTFNADINRQHWSNEAVVDETCYTVDNGDGTYTVKDGAVAYVNEGMLTGGFFAPKNVGYATLSEAIAAAVARNDNPVVLIKDITEDITIVDDATVVIDLNTKTLNDYIAPCKPASLTVKNGSIVNTNGSYSAIEINSGKLVIENVNIDSARHGVRIDGEVEAVINGGEYTLNATSGTRHAVNVSGAADVIIKDGTFVGPKGTTMDSGSAVCVQSGANVTIEGGNFSGGKNATLGVSGTMAIYGGTFDQDPSAYVANDYFAYDETGAFVVEEEMVAKIGDVKYKTLQDAVNAAQEGDTIVIRNDFDLDTSVTVANGKKITLDLNGKTITGADNNTTGNFYLIDNRGDLTITGEGKITLAATTNREWNASSVVVANNPGGKLTVNGGTLEHLGGTDMAYGIDNLTNGKGTYAETIINGGTIKSTYRAIRQFLNGIEAQNILNVNGGTVEGANKSVWMQDPSKNANTGTLTVSENATLNGDVYLFVTAGSTEWPVEVSIAKSAVNGEVLSANVPAGYELVEENGYYGIEVTTADVYTVEAIASMPEVRYNNGNPDSFTVKYVVTGGNVIGAMAQFKYDTELFTCTEDPNATGRIRMNSYSLITDANGETVIKELHFTVKKNVDVNTIYKFVPEYVQVVSSYDDAASGAQDGYVESVIGEDVTVIAQYDVTLDSENTLAGNTYVDANTDYSATINGFDENKTYTITYTMGGVEQPAITVTKDNDVNGGFIIENVTGDIVFTNVTSELNFELILLPEAVTGHTLVLIKDGVSSGYKYNDVEMYAVERYVGLTEIVENADRGEFVAEDGVDILNATSVRAILIKGGVSLDEARAAITVYDKPSDSIEKSFDVNRNGKVFFNDAMTAFGCYGRQYDVGLELAYYLASDVNTDFMIDTDDYDDTVEECWANLD